MVTLDQSKWENILMSPKSQLEVQQWGQGNSRGIARPKWEIILIDLTERLGNEVEEFHIKVAFWDITWANLSETSSKVSVPWSNYQDLD